MTDGQASWNDVADAIRARGSDEATQLCLAVPYRNLVECQRFLGWHYYSREDFPKSAVWFGKAAEMKDPEATFGLASVCLGIGNHRQAFEYMTRAAELNYPRAYYWIGCCFLEGKGGQPRDLDAAERLFRLSASTGFFAGQKGLIYVLRLKRHRLWRWIDYFRLILLALRAGHVTIRNRQDWRIIDVPNAFDRKELRLRPSPRGM